MPAYHVFVDAAEDGSTVGKERLANAIAEHYGLPVAELRTRIASGRFRVKGNCDGATADMYVRDLTRLGARCSVEEATPKNVAKTPLPFPAVTPGATTTGVPPTPPSTTLPPPIAKQAQPSPLGNYQSGLSAAFSGSREAPVANLGALGALEGNGEFAFTLASVDGAADDEPPPPKPASFEPPGSASIGPSPERSKPGAPKKKAAPKDVPIDMFAPPDAASDELKVDLAPEEEERSARKRASTPPPGLAVVETEPAPAPAASGRYSRPSLQAPLSDAPAPKTSRLPGVLANVNARFAIGVVLAIVIGFIPAHLVASVREKSAFESVDRKVIATQKESDTPEAYAGLDTFRSDQLDRKHDDRRTIAIMAMLIWGVVGAGIGYVWFRRIPWDRLDESL